MNEIKIFENAEFGKVRTVIIDGEIWFVGKDVVELLGYTNTSKTLSDHCKGVTKCYIPHPQGNGTLEVNIIPERDLYRLIMRSKLPSAERFEEWVVGDVLPSIRKTGFYSMNGIAQKMVANPQFMIEIIDELRKQVERAEKAEGTVAILTHVNKTYTVTEIAKELNMKSAIELNKKLAELHIQYKVNGTWVFYSKYSNLGYEEIKQEVLDSGRVVYHRKITQRGREFIIGAINKALEAVS